MGSLDPAKILVILIIALVVLGPERLPKVARQAGAIWRELTKVRDQVTEEIRSAIPDLGLPDMPNIPKMPKNMVSGFISDLTKPSVANVGGDAAGTVEVHSEVDAAGNEELVSSSSSGSHENGASFSDGPSAAGTVGPSSWARGAVADDFRRAKVAPPAYEDLPVGFDDASMN